MAVLSIIFLEYNITIDLPKTLSPTVKEAIREVIIILYNIPFLISYISINL